MASRYTYRPADANDYYSGQSGGDGTKSQYGDQTLASRRQYGGHYNVAMDTDAHHVQMKRFGPGEVVVHHLNVGMGGWSYWLYPFTLTLTRVLGFFFMSDNNTHYYYTIICCYFKDMI